MTPDTKKWPPDWWHHIAQLLDRIVAGSGFVVWAVPVIVRAGGLQGSWRLGARALRRTVCGGLLIAGLGLLCRPVAASDAEQGDALQKITQGTISAINAHGVAVEYVRSDGSVREMYLPFEADVRVQGVSQLGQINVGDTVLVEYRETIKKGTPGQSATASKAAVKIALVRRAAAQPAAVEPPEEAAEAQPVPAAETPKADDPAH